MGVLCLDNLLLVSNGKKTVTVGVEVDGAEFHADAGKQRERDLALGIPVLHVSADELGTPGLISRILRWAHQQLAA